LKTTVPVVMLTWVALLAAFAFGADSSVDQAASPVLVELFTSEGCSSCPPADALLEKLDSQPIAGAQIIALSEHVDYWNHDGWVDPYSSKFFTDRQGEYERRFGLSSAFTPQMVIAGATQMNGSDARAIAHAIDLARSRELFPIHISYISMENAKALRVHIQVGTLPASFKGHKADIFVAVALNHAQSHVSSGENQGRDIRHVAVAESIDKVGTLEKGKGFDREVVIKLKSGADTANLRLIAFVQGSDNGEVIGATLLKDLIATGPANTAAR